MYQPELQDKERNNYEKKSEATHLVEINQTNIDRVDSTIVESSKDAVKRISYDKVDSVVDCWRDSNDPRARKGYAKRGQSTDKFVNEKNVNQEVLTEVVVNKEFINQENCDVRIVCESEIDENIVNENIVNKEVINRQIINNDSLTSCQIPSRNIEIVTPPMTTNKIVKIKTISPLIEMLANSYCSQREIDPNPSITLSRRSSAQIFDQTSQRSIKSDFDLKTSQEKCFLRQSNTKVGEVITSKNITQQTTENYTSIQKTTDQNPQKTTENSQNVLVTTLNDFEAYIEYNKDSIVEIDPIKGDKFIFTSGLDCHLKQYSILGET